MRHSYGPYGYSYSRFYNNYNNGFYGKREAEAEPEAKADGYFGNYGYGYNNFGYGYNRFYNNYNTGFYGKRDAEAEPEAKAEPEAFFGNYGYGSPSFGYGYNSPAVQYYGYGFNRFQSHF